MWCLCFFFLCSSGRFRYPRRQSENRQTDMFREGSGERCKIVKAQFSDQTVIFWVLRSRGTSIFTSRESHRPPAHANTKKNTISLNPRNAHATNNEGFSSPPPC